MLSLDEAVVDCVVGHQPSEEQLLFEYRRYAAAGVYPAATDEQVSETAGRLLEEGRITGDASGYRSPLVAAKEGWVAEFREERRRQRPQGELF